MIPYGRQSINQNDVSAVISALQGDFLTTGPLVEEFESALESLVGSPCVTVSSGTAALHCAYAAINIEPGDEIITPPMTFIATQATAVMLGAKIVFADILSDTGSINPAAVASAITPRTKAIVAVDYAGHPAELDELRAIADKYKIYLIEDAAHSIGSYYKDKPVGSIADITTFSFFPTKNMTTAEGGAVASKNASLLRKARLFARQGLIRNKEDFKITTEGAWHQEVHAFGLNYRLPDVLCALGLSQLKRLEEFKNHRKLIFETYNERLGEVREIKLPVMRNYVSPMWHLYPIHVEPKKRTEIFNELRNQGIGVQVNYIPAYRHPVFENMGFKHGMYPESDDFYSGQISIPIHTGISVAIAEQISEQLTKVVRKL